MIAKLALAMLLVAGDVGIAAAAPVWTSRPTANDIAQYYPEQAWRMNVEGHAVLNCEITADQHVEACKVVSEDPPGFGFGDAALKLSRLFVMKPAGSNGAPMENGGSVIIPMRFEAPQSEPVPPAGTATP